MKKKHEVPFFAGILLAIFCMTQSYAAAEERPCLQKTCFERMMTHLAKEDFFKQLAIIKQEHPEISDPKELVERAAEQVTEFPLSLGLSIQDLIDQNLIREIFCGFELNLSGMYLNDLTGIDNIPNIEHIASLYLNDNKLIDIPPHIFKKLTDLNMLYLNNNLLTTIYPGEFNYDNLVTVNLSNNQVVTIYPGAFSSQNLYRIILTNNKLTNIEPGTFTNLTQLRFLNLSNNKITDIASGAFRNLPNLVYLDFDKNKIHDIAPRAFQGLTNLRTVYLTNNHITDGNIQERISAELFATAAPDLQIQWAR